MTFDTRGYTMMGVSPEQAARSLLDGRRRRDRRQLRQRPRRAAAGHREDARRRAGRRSSSRSRTPGCPSSSTCGRSTGPIRRSMAEAGARVPGRRRPDHRGVLRVVAGPPRRDGGGARRRRRRRAELAPLSARSPSASRSPASIRTGRRFSAGVSGHEKLRRVDARRVVGEVEVDRVRPVLVRLEVEVAAGAVGLGAARRVEERHEQRVVARGRRRARRRSAAAAAVELERERARPMGRPELAVRGRDLEVRRLVAGVRLERQALEDEVDVDRVVRQAVKSSRSSGGIGLSAERS